MSNFLLLIPSVVVFYMVYLNICKYKFSLLEILVTVFFSYIIATLGIVVSEFSTIPLSIAEIMANLSITGCSMILTYKKIKNLLLSGYYAFLSMIIAMIGNTTVGIIVNISFRTTNEDIRTNLILFFITLILTLTICYGISRYVGNQVHKCFIQLSIEIKHIYGAFGFTLSVLTLLLSYVNIFLYSVFEDKVLLSTINVVLIAFVFIVAVIMMGAYSLSLQKQMEAEYKSKAHENFKDTAIQIETAYDDMRNFRHDHYNLMHALMGYADEDNLKGLKEYLAQNMSYAKGIMDNLNVSMECLKFIHIPELRGLLSVKCAHAQTRGIEVALDIVEPIDDIPINRMDLCRIVGIMMDNAIDELLSQENIHKLIKFGIIIDGSNTLIVCSNICKDTPPIDNIFDEAYSTKGKGRGIGLCNLKRISKEYMNLSVTVHAEEGEFTILVTIR